LERGKLLSAVDIRAMQRLNLKATHKPVRDYFEALQQFSRIGVSHEGAVRSAFQSLLETVEIVRGLPELGVAADA